MHERRIELASLYAEFGSALWAYASRQLQDRHDAEEVLQDTFLAAAKNPDGVCAAASQKAWLFGIARNLCHERMRNIVRHRNEPIMGEPPILEPEGDDPRLDEVRKAVLRLPQTQRETLELRVTSELTYAETAAVLGVPVGTVRSRLHDAILAIREMVGMAIECKAGK